MADQTQVEVEVEPIFGGCEGPDAMYVKLISSDGHEFIIKREHALTSGTIKAMLSGPGMSRPISLNHCWTFTFVGFVFPRNETTPELRRLILRQCALCKYEQVKWKCSYLF